MGGGPTSLASGSEVLNTKQMVVQTDETTHKLLSGDPNNPYRHQPSPPTLHTTITISPCKLAPEAFTIGMWLQSKHLGNWLWPQEEATWQEW